MKYLVVSRKSGLFHLAKWLKAELGEDNVRCCSLRENYQKKAWKGLLTQSRLRHRPGTAEALDTWLNSVVGPDCTLITDDRTLSMTAERLGLPCLGQPMIEPSEAPDSPLALGGWWDGSCLLSPHWLALDWGLWPGGQGPKRIGAWALCRNDVTPPPIKLLEPLVSQLGKFRGALALDLHWDDTEKGWRSGTLRAGWSPHGLLMLHGMPQATLVLEGGSAPLLAPFTVGVGVSIPPYPYSSSGGLPVPFLAPAEVQRWLLLDDVCSGRGGLSTAGLSGFVATAVGRGRTLERARGQAVVVAAALGLPEGQFRNDAFSWLPEGLAILETRGWWG